MKSNKEKDEGLYVKWKGYDSSFNGWIDEKISLHKISCFPKPDRDKIKVELDLFDYATKSEVKKQQVLIHLNLLKSLI